MQKFIKLAKNLKFQQKPQQISMSFFFAEPFFFWGGWRSWKVHPALLSAVNALVVEAWPVARSEVLGEADGAASKAPWGDTFNPSQDSQ